MVRLIFGAFIAAALVSVIYLLTRVRKFRVVRKLSGVNRLLSWLLAAIPVAALIFYAVKDTVNGVIVLIHLLVFWLLAELLGVIIRKATGKKWDFYLEGVVAVLVSVIYLSAGWYLAHHVVETDYQISTQKDLGTDSLRIVQISDSHMGCTFDGEGFARHMETVQRTDPDLVVVTGDYVDDDSTKEDMIRATQALGELDTTYGVYWIFGNHDRGYFGYRNYTEPELLEELKKNNVHVMIDDKVMITDGICLIGREDRSIRSRKSMQELMDGIDPSVYTIVLDHQPHDFEAQKEAGVDLVLCGHTHGGQMFPVGLLGEWSGANDKTYGLEVRDGTTYIVNSGISDWAIRFKTATIAEFGVIDLSATQA